MGWKTPVFWPVEVWHLHEAVISMFLLSRVRLFWLIGWVARLLLLLVPLGLKPSGVADLFKWNSATSTLSFKKFNVNLTIQLDEVIDLIFSELPDELMF